ncbi:NAD-dependent epimerase [Leeuwenhoekiella marinoflava]|uniref:UDP-glucuronate 4-epimerase n=2 Tax=Leeuwenhoekiella marinoflava TaxID=988 RepID=A0A4Q0PGH5_9FLAO|nr:NAD-dependent epimerase [Leeuwenhoekiella marinoflava]RXG25993.1 UDP-glucuronate 4-epimerase [Leeuwenhoekiella marinoflava]SHF75280.1 UDP-glucuronate 4-epimerase [Leeuwenhoekiella marinoflava DSM 3653]
MKVLVTGAAGFIGFHFCKFLLDQGHKVVGLDNVNDYYNVDLKYDRLKELGIPRFQAEVFNIPVPSDLDSNFSFIRANLEDAETLNRVFKSEQFDQVCNLAAQAGVRYSIENPSVYVSSNVVGFLNILECCRHYKIKHLVYASSSSVYGENKKVPFSEQDIVDKPISLYAATKKSNELMAYTYSHLYNIPMTGLRFFTVYGPWGRPDMAIYLFAKAISEDKSIKIFNQGEMSRDFTYIDDIVNGIYLAHKNAPTGSKGIAPWQLFNIGNGSPQSLMHFIESIERHMNKTSQKEFLDMQPGDVPQTWADTSSLEAFGYKSSIAIDQGVGYFIDWFKAYHSLNE